MGVAVLYWWSMATKKRQLNLELLRILSMFMVVGLHLFGKTNLLYTLPKLSGAYYVGWLIFTLFYVSVNCFILISGYFLVDSKFRLSKLLQLFLEVTFYTVVIYAVCVYLGLAPLGAKASISALLPVFTKEYWFVTAYVQMYLLSPFANILIRNMNKQQHFWLLVTLVSIFSVWPNIFLTSNFIPGSNFVWFMILYFVAAYASRYYVVEHKPQKYLIGYLGSTTIAFGIFVAGVLAQRHGLGEMLLSLGKASYDYRSVLIFTGSLMLFLTFLNLRDIKNKLAASGISYFAPLTFGVYLIHNNPYLQTIIWRKFGLASKGEGVSLLFYSLAAVIVIYVGSSLIEKLRAVVFRVIGDSRIFKAITQKAIRKANIIARRYEALFE